MKHREHIIENYLDAYNQFDIKRMVRDFDFTIIFENIQNGDTNMHLDGLEEFLNQAEQAKSIFSIRKQTPLSYKHSQNKSEVQIEYQATVASDLPNGLKKDQKIELKGRSLFEFSESGKIIKLTDIS